MATSTTMVEKGEEEQAPERAGLPARKRYALAWTAGAAVAVLVFAWLVTGGTGALLVEEPAVSDFHDVQVRAWFDGRWDVPPEAVTIEGFVTDGRTYVYFGPVPALLRLPLLAVTESLDGRLTRSSLLAAYVVALVSCGVLGWRTRRLVRGDEELPRWEAIAVASAAFVMGTGSVLLFLGSRAIVYHETTLWAVALTIAGFAALVGHLRDGRIRSLAVTTFLAVAAMLTRGSVGVGPGVALGLVTVAQAYRFVRAGRGADGADRPDRPSWKRVAALGVATLLPFAAFSAINLLKFRSLWSLPLDRQAVTSAESLDGAARRAALADNDGSMFGFKFVPTTALQYGRPDGIGLQRAFPWIRFPGRAPPVGSVTFDTIDPAASATPTMIGLVALGALGLAGIVRRRELRALVPVLGGAAAGALTVLTIAYIAHRYVGDLFPLVAVAALAGLAWVPTLRPPRWQALAGTAGLAVLGAFSVWANLALSLDFQRFGSPNGDVAGRAVLVGWQVAVSGPSAFDVQRSPRDLPPPGPDGTFAVIGDCGGLYRSTGDEWTPVERTPATGLFRYRATFASGPPGVVPVLRATDPTADAPLVLRRLDDGQVRFETTDRAGTHVTGTSFAPGGEPHDVELVVDARTTEVAVTVDGDRVLQAHYSLLPADPLAPQREWAATLDPQPTSAEVCRQLVP
jgi:hypothetical protein